MLNGVNAAQWRKNGMMEVGEGKVVGDVKKIHNYHTGLQTTILHQRHHTFS